MSAPVGYGKTTLLGEWADEVPGATYVALERHDDDPVSLLASLATALGHVEPVDPTVTRLLSEPGHALQSTLLPRLVESLWVRRTPTVLMIDDADHLRAQASLDVIASLMLHLPPSMRLAVASRQPAAAAVGAPRGRGPPARARCPGAGARCVGCGGDGGGHGSPDLVRMGRQPGGPDGGMAGGDLPRVAGSRIEARWLRVDPRTTPGYREGDLGGIHALRADRSRWTKTRSVGCFAPPSSKP